MKKVLALVLTWVMLLGCIPGTAEGQNETVLPAVGDVISGFEVKEIRSFRMYGAEQVLFEHRKTGGQMLWIANEDPNRVFQLTFRTRPSDDTGLPHVFEHATLFGSEKYPSKDLFFGLGYQTYQTYMNAYTADACTGYPLASLSEKQLLALADYYVDSCFHPLIMADESIFATQAWHYNLPDPDAELTYEGVVYSEMQGAITLARAALDNANRVTFPGAALSYNYGGLPEHIPEMTWEAVKDFHTRYYHPSNCFAVLYGKIEDVSAFLTLLDGAFSEYEKADFTDTEEGYTRITEPVISSVPYPMAEGTDPANQAVIYYYILCPGMKEDAAQEDLIDHVCTLLDEPGSVLQQKMEKKFPAGSVSCGREVAAPDDAIVFVAGGMNENDAEAFKALVDESLKDIAENGFAPEMVDSVMVRLEILNRLSLENAEPWDGVVNSVAYDYAVTGNPFEYSEQTENLSGMEEENRQGLLKEACAKWLTEPALYTLTTTYPAPGEKEKADAALAEKLAEIKAGMSAEQLEAVVAETNAFALEEKSAEEPDAGEESGAASEANLANELIAKLKVVSSQDLPEEIRTYPVSDETDENGIRHIDVTAAVDGIGKVQLLLDAAALPQEDIHWMRLYTRLLGQLDTENHTRDELDVLTARYLNDRVIGVNTADLQDSMHPYVCIEWTALDSDLAAGYDLAEELLFRTKFDDTQVIADRIEAQISYVRNIINQNAYQIEWYRGMADRFPFYRYYTYLNFTDYYAFLLQLKEQIAADPESVAEQFRKLQSFFANNAGAVAAFAGSRESAALNRPLADAFMAKLNHEEREAAVYDLPVPAAREALIIDGNVQFNIVVGTPDDLGLEGFDAGLNAVSQVISDLLLVPVLRDQMGVYTPFTGFTDNGTLYLITYRDPNLRDTFDFYATLADRIEKIDVTQEVLDGYIQSIFAGYAKPEGELSGAASAVQTVLEGRSQEEKLEYMRQLKAITPETVKTAAELYRKAWENGVHSTAGSASAVQEAADLFDSILNPFNVEAASDAEITDVPEDHEYYAGIRFALENGLMNPKEDGIFAPDDAATVGDYLGGLNVLFGLGGNDPQAARETFLQYQLITPKTNIAAELHEDFLCKLLNDATGQTMLTTDTPDAPVLRGDLADLLYQLSGGAGE